MCVSKSNGRSVDAFGFDEAESVDVRMGRRYGASGTYVCVCFVRCSIDRITWRWKGNERALRMSLQ